MKKTLKASYSKLMKLLNIDGIAGFAFIAIALTFGTVLLQITPPMWGADETSHTARVYQLSKGQLYADRNQDGSYGGNIPYNLAELTRYVYQDFYDVLPARGADPTTSSAVNSKEVYDGYKSEEFDKKISTSQFTGAAAYSPLAYPGPLVGMSLANLMNLNMGNAITLSRLGGLLTYIAVVWWALYLLRKKSVKWVIFGLALLPMSVYQASVITGDSILIAASLLAFACVIKLFDKAKDAKIRWHLLISLFIAAVFIVSSKPNYIILLLPIIFLPAHNWPSKKSEIYYKTSIFIVSVVLAVAWALFVRQIAEAGSMLNTQFPPSAIDSVEQAKIMLTHPLGFAADLYRTLIQDFNRFMTIGIFGLLGFNYIQIPLSAVIPAAISLVLAALLTSKGKLSDVVVDYKLGSIFILPFLICLLSIFVFFYLSYTPVAYPTILGVQGRYFIPLLPFAFYGLRKLLPVRVYMSRTLAAVFFPTIAVLVLSISISYYYLVLY